MMNFRKMSQTNCPADYSKDTLHTQLIKRKGVKHS